MFSLSDIILTSFHLASRVSDEGYGKANGAGRCSQHLSGYLTGDGRPAKVGAGIKEGRLNKVEGWRENDWKTGINTMA